MNNPPRPESGNHSLTVLALTALVVVLFSLACFSSYQRLRAEHQAQSRAEAQRMLLAFEAHSVRLFDYADGYLRAVRSFRDEFGEGDKWERFVRESKAPHAETFTGIVTTVDRDGWITYQSETPREKLRSFGSMAALDHYRFLSRQQGDALFVGATRIGKVTGKAQFRLGRPLLKDGKFDGEVIVTLLPEHITSFYRNLSLGRHSSVTLLTLEPRLIAGMPPPPPEMYDRPLPELMSVYGISGEQAAAGSAYGVVSPLDHVRRDVFFKVLADYPVVLVIGIAEEDIDDSLADARRNLMLLALAFAVLATIMCALVLNMIRKNRLLLASETLSQMTNQQLQTASERLRLLASVFHNSSEAFLITDADNRILEVNAAFSRLTGYSGEEVRGENPRILSAGKESVDFYRGMWQSIDDDGFWQGEIHDRRKNGEVYPKRLAINVVRNAAGAVTNYVGSFADISESKRAEEKIQHLAFYDMLTALPNRRLFAERLTHAIAICARSGNHAALLFLDLDNFKTLNDAQGHQAGDELLVMVAQRLQTCVREADTVARLGGDEFVLLLEELDPLEAAAALEARAVAGKIVTELSRPFALNSGTHGGTTSVGIVLFAGEAESADTLLAHADSAMYAAKSSGKNAFCFYDPQMQRTLEKRAELEQELQQAATNGQLLLHYQLQVDNQGRALGAEALIRWEHPRLGRVPPGDFIPLAEESGLIVGIGQWVLEQAGIRLRAWRELPHACDLSLAVNISARQFFLPDFVEQVRAVMTKYDIAPRRLKLELTESMVLQDVDKAVARMHELKALGAVLSMDDFGTGYSSLGYLKRLPFDQIKIDKSFVDHIEEGGSDAFIVMTVFTIGTLLGMDVVAEGVETAEQVEHLKNLGCPAFQGYFFARPVPLGELEAMLRQRGAGTTGRSV